MKSIEQMTEGMEHLITNCRSALNGEYYLTDKKLSVQLKVDRRTLQDYWNEGYLPYILLGGKILYWESDIEKVLEEEYWRRSDLNGKSTLLYQYLHYLMGIWCRYQYNDANCTKQIGLSYWVIKIYIELIWFPFHLFDRVAN